MAPATYTRLTRFALWALTAIVVTGTSVRLTGSGLGCEDWPTCSEDRFVADLEYHALIEFANRLFTGVVAVAVIMAVAGALVRRPRRRDLTVLSLGLVVGVLAQVLLGALLVLSELDPRFTMGHFLLSMVLLWNAAVLDTKARHPEPHRHQFTDTSRPDTDLRHKTATQPPARETRHDTGTHQSPDTQHNTGTHHDTGTRVLLWAVFVVGTVLLVSGTLVTGAGPHAGDTRAERLPLLVREVARVHSIIAITLLALVLAAWWRLRSLDNSHSTPTGTMTDHTSHMTGHKRTARVKATMRAWYSRLLGHMTEHKRMAWVAGLLTVQGVLGYTQYFMGVPALLVGIHVTLAAITWIVIVKAVHTSATTTRDVPAHTYVPHRRRYRDSAVTPGTVMAQS